MVLKFWSGVHEGKTIFFLWLHLWHVGILRLGVESEREAEAYATATETPDPSCLWDLRCSLWQHGIINPPSHNRNWKTIFLTMLFACFILILETALDFSRAYMMFSQQNRMNTEMGRTQLASVKSDIKGFWEPQGFTGLFLKPQTNADSPCALRTWPQSYLTGLLLDRVGESMWNMATLPLVCGRNSISLLPGLVY